MKTNLFFKLKTVHNLNKTNFLLLQFYYKVCKKYILKLLVHHETNTN